MKTIEVLACSFSSWYPKFTKTSIKSVVLPLPEDFLAYLQSEQTVVLPVECDSEWGATKDEDKADSPDFPEEVQEEGECCRPSFPEFSSKVRETVARLGGSVFCKLNWSAPRDATWVAFANSLRCSHLSEIYLLLKSSQFVRHDLTAPFKICCDSDNDPDVRYELVLREWAEINPGHEFRCFVRGNVLVGITQRDGTNYYRHIRGERDSIVKDISSFFDEHVCMKFPLEDYVFDLVRQSKDSVKLVDFNPFGVTTDSILFDWEELLLENGRALDFRFVETDSGIQPNGLRQYSLPIDVVDLTTGADADKLVDFLKLQERAADWVQ